jgi:hypothetical protein
MLPGRQSTTSFPKGAAHRSKACGVSDEIGGLVVQDEVGVHDLQAGIWNQPELDHTKLTYRHAGRDYRLTDVHGRVVKEILA